MQLKAKQKVILAMLLASSIVMTGCGQPSNDANTSNVTSTVLSVISPTGTIQGNLIDAVSQKPIVGAVIDIGLATATTNQDGQFVLANVPATQIGTGAAQGTTLQGNYEVSINLKNVTSPVNMSTATTGRYPDFSFKQAQVEYTSDVSHPLTGIAKGYQFTVGKLDASVVGVVTDANGTPVVAGYNVTLYSAVNAQNSTTGSTGQGPVVNPGSNSGHIIGTTTTDASGNFTFANIEAGVNFMIAAQDAAYTKYGERSFTAPTDNATRTLSFQSGDAVVVASTDTVKPTVVSVTPENNSDITPAATNVVFTFSEPIKQTTPVADVSPSNPNGLYSLVNVNFNGPKSLASNLTHTLAWSADRKTLTVTLPTVGASSKYTVDISPAQPQLKDDADNAVAAVVAKYTEKLAVDFTTNGGATAAAPTIAITNAASINATSFTTGAPVAVSLDWLPTSGAKGYNIYRTMNEVWGATTNAHPTVKLNTTAQLTTNYSDGFSNCWDPALATFTAKCDYVENNAVKLTYSYVVKAVNSDGTESAASSAVVAADAVAPRLVAGTAVACGNASTTCDATNTNITAITIPFDEQMDKVSATTPANYAGSVVTFSSATYTPATITAGPAILAANVAKVKLTLSNPISVNRKLYGSITTGPDGVVATTAAGDDVQAIPVGQGSLGGLTNGPACVTAAANGIDLILAAAVAADDVLIQGTGATKAIVYTGPNGVCNTTKPAGAYDQTLPVNTGTPYTVAVSVGPNGIMDTNPVGDDTGVVVTVSGVTDVAGNAIAGKTKYNSSGTVQ